MEKLKTLYFGTPDFSVPCLELLHNHPQIDLIGVVTMPDRPAGRGKKLQSPAVAEFAKEHNLTLYQTENINREEEILEIFEKQEVDFIVVLAFAQFLGSRILNLPKKGCFNIHTSLLPKYRGAAPIQYALLNGDETTGVSIQRMVKKMDAGDIAHSRPVDIGSNETGGELYNKLKQEAAHTLNDFIDDLKNDNIEYIVQDENKVSFAPTLKKEDGLIDFKNKEYKDIHNQVRALSPWPGTYSFLGGKRLKVLEIQKEQTPLSPGECSTKMGSLLVGCLDSSLRLTKVQLEGKKACTDMELLNGLKNNNDFQYIISSEKN